MNNLNYVTTNRLYISQFLTKDQIHSSIFQDGIEQKGAGVKFYGKLLGKFLCNLGFSSKITLNKSEMYINNKSLCKFVIRSYERQNCESSHTLAAEMNRLYILKNDRGYDSYQLKSVKNHLKELQKNGQVLTIQQVVGNLLLTAGKYSPT